MQLTERQKTLKKYLHINFKSGKYFSIEEICAANLGYVLNTNPRVHDKCISLSYDVKALNWATNVKCYIPIVKDDKGGIKLCENRQELEDFIAKEERKVEKACQYKNHLKSLIQLDGSIPCIDLANKVLGLDELKVIEIYKGE